MNGKWLVILLGLGFLPGHATADQTWREQSRRVEPAAGLQTLMVENSRGRVDVHPSADGSLHITALKIVRAPSTGEAQRNARAATVELERDGSRYLIRVRYPRGESVHVNFWDGFDLSMPRLEVRLSIEVPTAMAVQLIASSGDLFTQDLEGEQRLRASSGDVSVDGARGPVDVATSSGDVSLMDARAARINTSSGDVEVHGRPAMVQVRTGSGDVDIDDASDSLRVETTSGDVTIDRAPRGAVVSTSSGEVRIRSTGGRLAVSTVSGQIQTHVTSPLRDAIFASSSGDIRLGLDSGVGCTLELHTTSGSLDLDVPVKTQTLTRRVVTGVVRNGDAPVTLRTASGSIAVVSGEP
jgi:hypothetical protein